MQPENLKKQPPAGTQDYLPDACRRKRYIERILAREFEAAGYDEIETPLFEYYDVFTHDSQPYVQEDMVKFFDRRGRILALRPDVTGSIARLAATKLAGAKDALRLFYIGNIYGIREPGEKIETAQAGVELIGRSGNHADAELIALAIESLRSLGVRDLSVEIGQVDYFRGLLSGTCLSEEATDRIRNLINEKNSVELEYLLSQLPLDDAVKEDLMELPGLFLEPNVLDRLSGKNAQCQRALDNLRSVLQILRECGLADNVSVDLGLLHDFHYYTGILFRGLLPGIGQPVLSGGRYDRLLEEFGSPSPAVGFAVNLTRLMQREDLGAEAERPSVVRLPFEQGGMKDAYALAVEKRRQGLRVVLEASEEESTC